MNFATEIQEKFNSVESARNQMTGKVELLHKQKAESDNMLEDLKAKYSYMESVVNVLKKYSRVKEQVLREKLDNIVTQGLRLIFGDGYKSKLEFSISRGQATIRPKIVTEVNGHELEADIATAHGGGLVNIASVIYQMLVLCLVKPRQRRILFLDEPFRNVSEEYLEPTAEFVRQLKEKLGIQIVLISHRPQMTEIADKVYNFSLHNGVTKVEADGE